MSSITHKTWDSNFFGFKTGELHYEPNLQDFQVITQKAVLENYRLIYWKVPVSDLVTNQLALSRHLYLGDTKMIYRINTEPDKLLMVDTEIKTWNGAPTHQLIALGIESGKYSRFKTDPHFPENTFEKMYTEWVMQSIKGTMGDNIFYLGNKSDIQGFVTLQFQKESATIGLIAVNHAYQHQGIASQLVAYACRIAQQNNKIALHVATQQANIAANKLYLKCNGQLIQAENIYHIWL